LTSQENLLDLGKRKKEKGKKKMRNSTACCDFARDNRDGHITLTRHIDWTPKPTVGDPAWEKNVNDLIATMPTDDLHSNLEKAGKKVDQTKDPRTMVEMLEIRQRIFRELNNRKN
jgi:hypothetical protein